MGILLLLIPISLLLLGVAVWAFWWAVKRGQFDDLETPAIHILSDDEPRSEAQGNRGDEAARGPFPLD